MVDFPSSYVLNLPHTQDDSGKQEFIEIPDPKHVISSLLWLESWGF